MRLDYRLVLIGCVAACAPMIPSAPPDRALAIQPPAAPAPAPTRVQERPYLDEGFEGWKQGFLARHGGDRRAAYERELASVSPDPTVIQRDRNQPEFSRPAGAYIQNAMSATRTSQGRARLDRVPSGVVQRFGVPAEILVSIWGLESSFGEIQGTSDVITSLATLAYDGRRRDWAESQLRDALNIVVDGRRSRDGLKGSWAGAMGQTQFMPDNYLRLGVDQNGDGRVDIWGTDADALASAANLLAQAGWKRDQAWTYEVTLPVGFDYALAESERRPWSYWASQGVSLTRGGSPTGAESMEEATILLPQGANGPAFLALPNHYIIRRYNNSVAYALAVGLTADAIASRPGLMASWPTEAAMSRDQRLGAQTALARLGYDPGGIDGVVGTGTRNALRRWQQANGRVADGHLTAALADELAGLR